MRLDRVVRQKSKSAIRLLRKGGATFADQGALAFCGYCWRTVFSVIREHRPAEQSTFDRTNGVDTSGIVRIAAMDIASGNYLHGTYYKASNEAGFLKALTELGIDYSQFTFVDYGSGKGLTLLLASGFPFRAIVGVEFGREIHEIAEQNIARFLKTPRACNDIRSVHMDVVEFVPPPGPLVCYFYEPFEAPVLSEVLRNLSESYAAHPRPILLVYHGSARDGPMGEQRRRCEELLGSAPFLEKTGEDDNGSYVYYRSHPAIG